MFLGKRELFTKTGKPETQAKRALHNFLAKDYPSAWRESGKKLHIWGLGVASRKLASVSMEIMPGDEVEALLEKSIKKGKNGGFRLAAPPNPLKGEFSRRMENSVILLINSLDIFFKPFPQN